jgi:hypothetical protein
VAEFEQNCGHCVVPRGHEEEKALGRWINMQQKITSTTKCKQTKRNFWLDMIGFASKDDKLWRQQHEKVVKFEHNCCGHRMVPGRKNEEDKSTGRWVSKQRQHHINDKM